MNKLLFLAAPLLVAACGYDYAIDDTGRVETGFAVQNEVSSPAGASAESTTARLYTGVASSFDSSMVTAGDLSDADVQEAVAVYEDQIRYRFDAFTETGWAMMQGSVAIHSELEDGMVLPVSDFDLGCAGPAPGQFDFDGPSSDGTITIEIDKYGTFLHFDVDFGSGGEMNGTVVLEPEAPVTSDPV